jgi:hypothetical protein
MLPNSALSADPAALDNAAESQVPNRSVKADRLGPVSAQATKVASADGVSYTLASATTEDVRSQDRINALLAGIPLSVPATKARPDSQIQQAQPSKAEPARPKLAALPPAPSKKLAPPAASTGVLDDAQIAGIRSRLRLTADQAEYWPAVEEALREVARTQLRHSKIAHGRATIDTDAPEVQKLKWAAMPLLMRLSEDQKNEVRKLARVIGLEQVASQI